MVVIWTWVGAVEGKWAKLIDIGQRLNQGAGLNVGVRGWEAARMTPGFWTE